MLKNKILLFIPMYNCEKQIGRVLKQLDSEVCEYIAECIIVNNRSKDKSEQVVEHFLENNDVNTKVSLFRNNDNYSLGGSHKVAFNYALKNGFDFVIVLHGDDQGDIHDLLPYIKDKTIESYDSFLGSRFAKGSILTNYSKFRIFGNRIFNVFISTILNHRLTDLGSGLNIYKTTYLKNKFYSNFPNSLSFNVFMLLYGVYSKSKFSFFALTWREDDQVSNAKLLKQTKEILNLILKYVLNKRNLFNGAENEYSKINYDSEIIYTTK
jgi:glycosyltransferase involved in cell wall biosynthesis